jgi:hypothetical protein
VFKIIHFIKLVLFYLPLRVELILPEVFFDEYLLNETVIRNCYSPCGNHSIQEYIQIQQSIESGELFALFRLVSLSEMAHCRLWNC